MTLKSFLLSGSALLSIAVSPAYALGDDPLSEAFAGGKVIFDYRLRYETVDQDNFDETAHALTSRIRAGFETAPLHNTKFLIDFEHIDAHTDEFNSTINGEAGFPVVPDPEVTELNRLQFTNTSIDDTVITLGRQRIKQHDDRFVGNVGWRQNEQTFDAVRVVNTSIEGLRADITYVDQVNRIFGDDSPMGRWNSSSWLMDFGYKVPTEALDLKVSAFTYLLDFENDAPAASSQTYGFEALAKKGAFSGKFRYAQQSDYGDQPVSYDANYYNVEGAYTRSGFTFKGGIEVLGSDGGVKGFATPLATLHKFNGFTDQFLGTPAVGLQDVYGSVAYVAKKVGPFDLLKAVADYHDFSADEGSTDFGGEFNMVLVGKVGKTTGLMKFGAFSDDELNTNGDVTKFWAQLEWSF